MAAPPHALFPGCRRTIFHDDLHCHGWLPFLERRDRHRPENWLDQLKLYRSCLPNGLYGHPPPIAVKPHQRHSLAPLPCRCLRDGLYGQPPPCAVRPQNSHLVSSSKCSCLPCGLYGQPGPWLDKPQYRHWPVAPLMARHSMWHAAPPSIQRHPAHAAGTARNSRQSFLAWHRGGDHHPPDARCSRAAGRTAPNYQMG